MKGLSEKEVSVRETTPFDGQKPGTSGLRKKTKVFMQPNYIPNFVQSVLDECSLKELQGSSFLIAGDGRYFNRESIYEIASILIGNGVGHIWIAKNGLASTPACSACIRERNGSICFGGFVLTASHNPGGINEDFGIKFNTSNGAPAQEELMERVYQRTLRIDRIKYMKLPKFSIDDIGLQVDMPGKFKIEVIDGFEEWLRVMKRCFHFPSIRRLFMMKNFKFVFDGMCGVSGAVAERLFVKELGASHSSLRNCSPKEDFGKLHPDPNLTYARPLAELLHVFDPENASESTPDFGAACDGDADRNLILGKGVFVTPSDSVAIIASYAEKCIPFFMAEKIVGLARSMPTSAALDNVAKEKGVQLYETPTGWKYFTNLMDAKKINICGEESFGTGSTHVREKDGMWAIFSWLSILAYENGLMTDLEEFIESNRGVDGHIEASKINACVFNSQLDEGAVEKSSRKPFRSIGSIQRDFWERNGRNYYSRYDFEGVSSEGANLMMKGLESLSKITMEEIHEKFNDKIDADLWKTINLTRIEIFNYEDPVDGFESKNQGVIAKTASGSRIIWRLSGTGSAGATIRIYFELFELNKEKLNQKPSEVLEDMIRFALLLCDVKKYVGTDKPSVVT